MLVVARGGVRCERAAVGAALELRADARGEPVGCRRRQAAMGRVRTHADTDNTQSSSRAFVADLAFGPRPG